MEVEEIQSQACKFSRIGNGRIDSSKVSQKDQYPDDEEDGEQQKKQQQQLRLIRRAGADNTGGGGGNRLRGWHHSSRIIRVSRASGGKDRHSKVWTSKGLRDRRVRLSVTTAIQFYDLQDRLGYDQPSKAVEWLVNAAADSIAELPSLSNFSFPDTPNQLSDESKKESEGTDQLQQGLDSVDQLDQSQSQSQSHRQHGSISKSACSSNSESELGLNRVKARERAAKEKKNQKEKESQFNANQHHHHHVNPISLSSSFTELLTGGISSVDNNNDTSPSGSSQPNEEANFFHKAAAARPWTATPLDYFHSGLFGPSSSRPPHHFTGQIQLGSSNSLPQAMAIPAPFSMTNENHQEMQHFSFVPDQYLIPVTATQPGPGGDCNLNFTISAGLDGYNRRTLQSNSSPSLLPHLQRYGSSSPIDGSNVPFFIGTTPPVENHHHQFSAGFDGRLHLYYGDGSRHSGQKDKGKN